MSTEQDDRVSRLKDYRAKIESEHNLMQQRILDFQNESKKISQQFNTDFSKIKKGILEEINSIMSNVDGLNRELKAYKDKTLVSEKDALNNRLENLLGQITGNVENLQKRISNLSSVQEEEVSTIYSEMAKKVNVGLNDIYSNQRSKVSDFENDISGWLGTIQRDMRALVERESANLNEMTETIASSFSETLSEFKKNIVSLSDVKETEVDAIFATTVSDSVSRMEIGKEDLIAGIDGLKYKLEESLKKQEELNQEMRKEIQELLGTSKTEVMSRVKVLKDEHLENWNTYEEEQITKLSEFKESTGSSFKNALSKNEELETRLVAELQEKLKATFNQLQEQIFSTVSRVFEDFNATREKTYSSLISAMDKKFKEINRSFSQFGKDKVATQLEKTVTELDVTLLDFFDMTQKSVTDTVAKKKENFDALSASISNQFKEIQKGQEKNIDTTLYDVKNALRNKQSELLTAVAGIAPAADDHIETNQARINEIKSEISRTRSSDFEDLGKQISGIERDGMTALQNIVQSTHQKLDENVRVSEEATKNLVEGLEDQHKSTIANYRTEASQEFNKQLTDIEAYRENLKEKFEAFFDGQQKSFNQITSANRDHRESLDDKRRNLEIKLEESNRGIEAAIDSIKVNIDANTQNVSSSIKNVIKNVNETISDLR